MQLQPEIEEHEEHGPLFLGAYVPDPKTMIVPDPMTRFGVPRKLIRAMWIQAVPCLRVATGKVEPLAGLCGSDSKNNIFIFAVADSPCLALVPMN